MQNILFKLCTFSHSPPNFYRWDAWGSKVSWILVNTKSRFRPGSIWLWRLTCLSHCNTAFHENHKIIIKKHWQFSIYDLGNGSEIIKLFIFCPIFCLFPRHTHTKLCQRLYQTDRNGRTRARNQEQKKSLAGRCKMKFNLLNSWNKSYLYFLLWKIYGSFF